MSVRTPGQLVFPANFERMVASPLDASQLVQTHSALTQPDTFKSIVDGNDYSFKGMFTIVVNDENPYKNGLYYLKELPSTNIDNLEHVSTTTDTAYISNILDNSYAELSTNILNVQASNSAELANVSSFLDSELSNGFNSLTQTVNMTANTLISQINNLDTKTTQSLQTSANLLSSQINDLSIATTQNLELSTNTLATQISGLDSKTAYSLQLSTNTLNNSISALEADVNSHISSITLITFFFY